MRWGRPKNHSDNHDTVDRGVRARSLARSAERSDRRKRWPSVVAGVTVPVVLATLAVANPGVTISELKLNDGTVWITNARELKIGRYNAQVKELNGGVVATTSTFDVVQDENDALAVESASVSLIDPATMTYTSVAQIPGQSAVALNNKIAAVTDPTGKVWVTQVEQIDTISESAPVALDLSDGAATTVGDDGTVYSFDPGTGVVRKLTYSQGAAVETEGIELAGANGLAISANPSQTPHIALVGTTPIVIANTTLYTPRASVDLSQFGNQPSLQHNGETRGEVIVATDSSLIAVNIDSGRVRELITGTNGRPARPALVSGCLYSAWSASQNNYAVLCADQLAAERNTVPLQSLANMSATSELVFRVNRDQIVLNDTQVGRVWLPEDVPQSEDPNWEDVEAPEESDNTSNDDDNQDSEQSDTTQCTTNDRAPRARDDKYGVRPDRTTILYVLLNDSVGQCGILAITEIEDLPREFGTVQLIDNGRALQAEIKPSAQGQASFTYTITDGRGQNPPSTATVTLSIRPEDSNEKPVQLHKPRTEVEQGSSISYNVLANFQDPDGDQLVLSQATLPTEDGTLRFRKDGMVTYVADTEKFGTRRAEIVVSDGVEEISSFVEIDVRSPGTLPPTIDPIYRVGYVSSPIEVDVLSAVKSRSTGSVRLAAVDALAGTTIDTDIDAGTFSFSAPTPGSYYVSFTVVSSPHTVTGLARIDIREIPEDRLPPVAVSDVALLPAGGIVTVSPLANDFDPNGGVMVLTGVEPEAGSSLSVGVMEHRYVQIESRVALKKPETIHYTVDNGYASVQGTILVQPVEPSTEQRAPTVKPITVSVRTGGVVTIPVLDYANDADGDDITLVRDLPEPLPQDQGLLFASGNVLRYQAPNTPRTTKTTFVVEDSAGNTAIGELTVNVHVSSPDTKAPPQPKRITARAYAGEKIRIPIPLTGIDQDGDGVILLGQGDVVPSQGLISNVGADYLEYTAYSTGRGTDTFTYAVEDWTGQRAVGTIRVGIVEKPEMALPIVASDDSVTVQPGTTVAVKVTRNDVDPSGLALTLDPLLPLEGITATVESNTIVVEVPAAAEDKHTYTIPYTVRNEAGGFGEALLYVHVSTEAQILPPSVNDIVVAPYEVMNKTSVEVDIFAVAENPSGTPQELDLSVPSSHAQVAAVTGAGKITVQLAETAQTIPFKLTNPAAPQSAYTYAFISVPALGDFAPVLRPKARALVTSSAQELLIPLAEFVQVGPGKTAVIRDASSVKSSQSDGSSLLKDETTLRFVSERSFHGTAAITFEVWDSKSDTGKSSILTIPVTVRPAEELPPTFSPTVLQVPQGNEVIRVDLNQFVKPADGMPNDTYSYLVSATPAFGVRAAVEDSLLSVSAPSNATRGTRGEIALTVTYGVASKLNVAVPYEIVASTKQRPVAQTHEIIANAGEPTTVNVLQGAIDPVGEGLRVLDAAVLTSGTGTVSLKGSQVTVTPSADFAGTMKVSYTVTDSLNDPNRNTDGLVTVTVRKVPDAPSAPRPSNPSNRTVTLTWEAPSANGAPILDYRVTATPGGNTTVCRATTCDITGLANGTPYRFTVAARNDVGYSQESAVSTEIAPDILPSAPDAPTAKFGDKQIEVSWSAPRNEGSAILRYVLEISPGVGGEGVTERTVTGTSTVIPGLRNGTAYTVRVRAVNSAVAEGGAGPWSSYSEKVVPAGVPDSPKVDVTLPADTPLGRQINVSWAPGADNGDPISSFTVTAYSGSTEVASRKLDASATKWTFTDAENGVDYKFAVVARNKAGSSAPGTSEAISTFTAPSAPRPKTSEVLADRSYSQGGAVRYLWDVPGETGGRGIKISHYEVKDSDGSISGTSFVREDISPGQHSGDISVRACNTRGACSGWVTLNGQVALTKPQSPQIVKGNGDAYETYEFTINPRHTGGTNSMTLEYRVNQGAWQTYNGGAVNGRVTDFGSGTSKDITVEARSTNSQGSSSVASATFTVQKPQPPTAPTSARLNLSLDPNAFVTGTWQRATERGMRIEKYMYCVVKQGTVANCSDPSTPNSISIWEVDVNGDLRTRDIRVDRGATYELQVWAVARTSSGDRIAGSVAKATVDVPAEAPPTPTTP